MQNKVRPPQSVSLLSCKKGSAVDQVENIVFPQHRIKRKMIMSRRYRISGAFLVLLPLMSLMAFAADKQHEALAQHLTHMSYSEARPAILDRGWAPFENPVPDDLAFVARDMYDQGYVEVGLCSPVADAPCQFYFSNANRQYLKVLTTGEAPHIARVEVLDAEAFAEIRSVIWGE